MKKKQNLPKNTRILPIKNILPKLQEKTLKEVTLDDGKKVIYWFYYGKKAVADYLEYVCNSILHPGKEKILVLLGVNNLNNRELVESINRIDQSLK